MVPIRCYTLHYRDDKIITSTNVNPPQIMSKDNLIGSSKLETLLRIGSLEELEELECKNKRSKFFVLGTEIFLCCSTSQVHSNSQDLLVNTVLQNIQKYSSTSSKIGISSRSILICHKYSCGALMNKDPDGAIRIIDAPTSNPPIVFEIAFTHEPLALLFLEGVTYLTEYVEGIEYFIGLFIRPTLSEQFSACLFILKRNTPFNFKKGHLIEQLKQMKSTKDSSTRCIKNSLFDNDLKIIGYEDISPNLCDEFGVSLIFKREISDENLSSISTFNIELEIFPGEQGVAVITFGPDHWNIIRNSWLMWRELRARSSWDNADLSGIATDNR